MGRSQVVDTVRRHTLHKIRTVTRPLPDGVTVPYKIARRRIADRKGYPDSTAPFADRRLESYLPPIVQRGGSPVQTRLRTQAKRRKWRREQWYRMLPRAFSDVYASTYPSFHSYRFTH